MENETAIQFNAPEIPHPASHSFFLGGAGFDEARRMAKSLAGSRLIPEFFRRRPDDCIIVLEAAALSGISPLLLMQNIDIVDEQPVWRTPFLVVHISSCGRFNDLRYNDHGTPGTGSCGKSATAKRPDGTLLCGPLVTLDMAEAAGWTERNPKWREMPELMLANFAAIHFARQYAPDLFLGLKAEDEIAPAAPVHPACQDWAESEQKRLAAYLQKRNAPVTAVQIANFLKNRREVFNFDLIAANLEFIIDSITKEVAND